MEGTLECVLARYHAASCRSERSDGSACDFCAGAIGVKGKVVACGVKLAGAYDGHPSFKKLVARGYQVITF
jgi:hypothetical protein